MKDTIYREDAIKAIHNYWKGELSKMPMTDSEYGKVIDGDCDTLLKHNKELSTRIKDIPSADRPQGEWIVNIFDHKSICSVCGANETHFIYGTEMWYGLGKSKFCPYCGTRMKGANDETNH